MDLIQILSDAIEEDASDVFLISNLPVTFKIDGNLTYYNEEILHPDDTYRYIENIYEIHKTKNFESFLVSGDDDFSFSLPGVGRFRVNAYRQRNTLAAVIRIVSFETPDPLELNIPEIVINACMQHKGLVLVTGSAGSGKSTTLACVVAAINSQRKNHIITLEDPVEFIHRHKQSIVTQREIESDTVSYVKALRAALRQSPDVILLGEMRDHETTSTAMTAAETGQLVLSSLHTIGAAKTIDRIIDIFPPAQQHQIRIQLSMVLQTVISQQLLPSTDGKLIPAFEIMMMTPGIRNMIREEKVHQIDSAIFAGRDMGMITMDTSIYNLYAEDKITADTALAYSTNYEEMARRLDRSK